MKVGIFQGLSDDMTAPIDGGWLDGLMPLEDDPIKCCCCNVSDAHMPKGFSDRIGMGARFLIGLVPFDFHGIESLSHHAGELDVALNRISNELLKFVESNTSILCTERLLDLTPISTVIRVVHISYLEDRTLTRLTFDIRHT